MEQYNLRMSVKGKGSPTNNPHLFKKLYQQPITTKPHKKSKNNLNIIREL